MDNKNQNKRRSFFTRYNLERATNSHALILALVGAYLVYMIYMIINNYINGETSMKLSTVVIVSVILIAGGVFCFGYAIAIFYITRNKEEIGREQDIEMGYTDEYGNPIYYNDSEEGDPTEEEGFDEAAPTDAESSEEAAPEETTEY